MIHGLSRSFRTIRMKKGSIILASALALVSCNGENRSTNGGTNTAPKYVLPAPPAVLIDRTERTTYIIEHYWQGLDYADTAWLGDTPALEQVFGKWAALLACQPAGRNTEAAADAIARGNDYPDMQLRLLELADHYFNDPNSPYRNEELYIPILKAVLEAPNIADIDKVRPRYQLEKAMMNRPETRAADFAFVTREGCVQRLSDLCADYALLYFFNPDCHDCKRVAAYIAGSACFTDLLLKGSLSVLAIYPDEDLNAWKKYARSLPQEWSVARYAHPDARKAYDLPAIPCLYLLDRNKAVILKDAPVERIEEWLSDKVDQ